VAQLPTKHSSQADENIEMIIEPTSKPDPSPFSKSLENPEDEEEPFKLLNLQEC
jgi:hypothetical protein